MPYRVQLIDQAGYDLEQIRKNTRTLLEKEGLDLTGKSVFLKPSFVYPARAPHNRGVNTQPEFVGGVVRALKDMGAGKIWLGEDCLVGPSQAGFVAMGVLPYLRGFAEPVYLQDEERVEVEVDEPLVEGRFRMPRKLMEADVFISLPKIKVNMYATVSLSVKNHIGLLLGADRLSNHHYHIHKKITDLYRTRMPDFVLADAIMAGEGQGPMHCKAAPMNLILASANGPAADVVACHLMGFSIDEVEHLKLLHEMALGPGSLEEIEVSDMGLLDARARRFTRPQTDFEDYDPTLKFCIGTELACPEGCLGMIRGSLDRYLMDGNWKPVRGFTFIVGKPVDKLPENLDKRRTLVIGDCAEEHAKRGTFIAGCPVAPMSITYALLKKGINGPLHTRLRDLAWGFIARGLKIPLR